MDTTTISNSSISESDSIFNSPTINNIPSQLYNYGGGNIESTSVDSVSNDISPVDIPSVDTNINPVTTEIVSDLVTQPLPGKPKYVTYENPIEMEPIGIPVYLSGVVQLLSVMILLSKNKIREARITFFTIGLYMLIVHCSYSGKAHRLGKLAGLCRSLSYLMVFIPLFNVMLVLVDDFSNMWESIKYSPGKLKLQLPNVEFEKIDDDDDKDNK